MLIQETGGGGGPEHQQHDGGEEARPAQLLDALHGPPGSVVDPKPKRSELFSWIRIEIVGSYLCQKDLNFAC